MGTATVTGRDELGRIIDVQLTTTADVAPPGPETVASGGGEQTIRLLGPVQIAWDDFGGNGGNFPVLLAAIPDGATVIAAPVFVTTAFDANTTLQIGVAPSEDLTDASDLLTSTGINLASAPSGAPARYLIASRIADGSAYAVLREIRAVSDVSLMCYLSSGDPVTQGEATIYALIAEPSA
jgi:hypothetical protein